MLHLKDIDCKLPRDIPDEMMGRPEVMEGEEDTIMSSILHRIKICQLAEEIVSSCCIENDEARKANCVSGM